MKCEIIEEKIIEILEGKIIEKEIIEHFEKCKSCKSFYDYILEFKKELEKIEILEPSPYFEEKLISLISKEPVYLKILSLLSSFIIFSFILFLPYLFELFLLKLIIFFSKIMCMCKIFSNVFEFKVCYIILLFIFLFILTNMSILFFSTYLFKKFLFKEVKL